MKRLLFGLCIVLLAGSVNAVSFGVVNNSGSTAADSLGLPFFVYDSSGSVVALAAGDSLFLHVYYPSGAIAFQDTVAHGNSLITTTTVATTASSNTWKIAVADIDGSGKDGNFTYFIFLKDLTGSAQTQAYVGTFQLYQTRDFNVYLDSVITAVLSRLAPTTAGRTLDVATTGEAGVDFSNINGTLDAAELGTDAAQEIAGYSSDSVWYRALGNSIGEYPSVMTSARTRLFGLAPIVDSVRDSTANTASSFKVGGSFTSASGEKDIQGQLVTLVNSSNTKGQTRTITGFVANSTRGWMTVYPPFMFEPNSGDLLVLHGRGSRVDSLGYAWIEYDSSSGTLPDSIYATLDTLQSRLDAAISSRMATYTQPTGFLSATFPSGTIANTTNITAGTMTTTTTLTTNNDKTGYTLTVAEHGAIGDTVWTYDTTAFAGAATAGVALARTYDSTRAIIDSIQNLATVSLVADTVWKSLVSARSGVAGSFGDSSLGWGATAASSFDPAIDSVLVKGSAFNAALIVVDTAGNLRDSAISASKVMSNTVTAAKIATDAITDTKIATGAIGSAEIATDAIGSAELATGAVNEIWSQNVSGFTAGTAGYSLDSTKFLDPIRDTVNTILDTLVVYAQPTFDSIQAALDSIQALDMSERRMMNPLPGSIIPNGWLQVYEGTDTTTDGISGWGDGVGTAYLTTRRPFPGMKWSLYLDGTPGQSTATTLDAKLDTGTYLVTSMVYLPLSSDTVYFKCNNSASDAQNWVSSGTDVEYASGWTGWRQFTRLIRLVGDSAFFFVIGADGGDSAYIGNFGVIPYGAVGHTVVASGSGLDSSTTSRLLHRVVWGTSKSAGSDSSTLAERDATTAGGSTDTSMIKRMLYNNFNFRPTGKKVRFISASGDNSNGLTPATAWTDFTKIKDSTNTIYWVLPGTYADAKIEINRSGIYVMAAEGIGSVRLRNADDTLNANSIVQINSDSAQLIRDIKFIGFDLAHKVSYTTTPPDPDFQAAIWVRDSIEHCELSNNFFQVDSTFKTIAINDKHVRYLWVHDNWFAKSRTHAIDAGSDYSVYENNYIFDQRDHLGGNSGANSIEPIQIISNGSHNVIRNNYITSGSVLIRIQGDTNLVADNFLGYPVIRDTREMLVHSLALGNTFAGNWGRGNFPDTTSFSIGDDSMRYSLTVPAELGFIMNNVKTIGGFVDSTVEGDGSGSFTYKAVDTANDVGAQNVGITARNKAGQQLGITQTTDGNGSTIWGFTENDTIIFHAVEASGWNWNTPDTVFGVTNGGTDSTMGYADDVGSPSGGNECRLYGYVQDVIDTVDALENVQVFIQLTSIKNNTCDSTITARGSKSKHSDSTGYWSFDVALSSCLDDAQYRIWMRYEDNRTCETVVTAVGATKRVFWQCGD